MQNRGFRTIMPGAQEGRDAVRTHEAYLQTRSTPTTRLEWRQGRGAADRNGTELEAVGQIPLSCAANASNMRGVSVDGGGLSVFPEVSDEERTFGIGSFVPIGGICTAAQ